MGWFLWFYVVLIVVVFLILFLVVFLTKDPTKKANNANSMIIFLFAFMIFALAVTASYSSIAASSTGGSDSDEPNKVAHGYYTWAAIISWIGFAVTIIGIIYVIYSGYKRKSIQININDGTIKKTGGATKIYLIAITILVLLTGILSAIGAGYQGSSTGKTGYRAGIIAATTSLVLFALIVGLFVAHIVKEKHDQKMREKRKSEKMVSDNVKIK